VESPERGFYRVGRARQGSRTIAWDEHPFDFEEPRRFSVLRVYHTGPVAEAEFGAELVPQGQGTELVYRVRVRSRRPADVAANRRAFGVSMKRRFDRVFRSLARRLATASPPYPEPPALGPTFKRPLRQALGDVAHAERLVEFLVTAPEADLVRIRPFRLARLWSIPRDEALRLFLNATLKGVLGATWLVLCPSCRGAQAESATLSALTTEGHCPSCQAGFIADFDRLVELTFRLAPRWRLVEVVEFCVGGPQRTPHVVAQLGLPRGETADRMLRLLPGAYRAKAFLSGSVPCEVIEGGPNEVELTVTAEGITPRELTIGLECRLRAESRLEQSSYLAVERTEWADDACTAAYVSCFQDYRDLFGRDVLAPGVAVSVAEVTVLFTDLKDSTATYGRLGDASAFGLVRDHFAILTDIVRTHEGAIVKTIGDAIMAAFLDPAQALTAAYAMHDGIARLRAIDGEPVVLKVGLHAGPCFAVTLNERLDYFGTVVNMAARIQSQSVGGDTVIDEEVAARPSVAALLEGRAVETYEAELKGISGTRRLVRILPNA
jgi:class 3 adenylate cyclase